MLAQAYAHGGIAVALLGLCSIVAVAIIIERLWMTRRSRVLPRNLDAQLAELIRGGRLDEALAVCRRDDSPLSRLVISGIRAADRPRVEFNELVELTGRRELSQLQRFVPVLGTIAAIAPLLGLLGTVLGIIKTFALIEVHGIGNPQLLAGGISEALIATAAGIGIAVPSVIFYRYFLNRARQLALELEETLHQLLFDLPK
jgi:biopolymer transport protein ExbB